MNDSNVDFYKINYTFSSFVLIHRRQRTPHFSISRQKDFSPAHS